MLGGTACCLVDLEDGGGCGDGGGARLGAATKSAKGSSALPNALPKSANDCDDCDADEIPTTSCEMAMAICLACSRVRCMLVELSFFCSGAYFRKPMFLRRLLLPLLNSFVVVAVGSAAAAAACIERVKASSRRRVRLFDRLLDCSGDANVPPLVFANIFWRRVCVLVVVYVRYYLRQQLQESQTAF
jgi:hypothetical protein